MTIWIENSTDVMKRSIFTKAESAASIFPSTSKRQIGLKILEMISSIRSLPSCGASSWRLSPVVKMISPRMPTLKM